MWGWIVRIGIVALIAGGAFIFRDRLSGNAGELKVGDCFDDPAGVEIVEDVQHHPCNEAHTAEVVYVGKMEGANETYPSDAVVESWVDSYCVPAWTGYTGKNVFTDPILTLGWYQPSEEGWTNGDREVMCYAGRLDRASMSSSVRVTP
jgi:Septum formation